MRIEKVTSYKVDGKTFPTPEKAMAHVEELLFKHVEVFTNRFDVPAKASIDIMEYLLDNREALVELLSVVPYSENDDE